MSALIRRIPKKLPCFVWLESDGAHRVPFPVGETFVRIPWTRGLVFEMASIPYILLRYPDLSIGTVGMVYPNAALRDGGLVAVRVILFMRVVLVKLRYNKNAFVRIKTSASWAPFLEEKPSRRRFQTGDFQEKVTLLRVLRARTIAALQEEPFKEPLDIFSLSQQHRYSETTVGDLLVDRAAHLLNQFARERVVSKALREIFAEPNVERRLDRTIELYEFFLKNSREIS